METFGISTAIRMSQDRYLKDDKGAVKCEGSTVSWTSTVDIQMSRPGLMKTLPSLLLLGIAPPKNNRLTPFPLAGIGQ